MYETYFAKFPIPGQKIRFAFEFDLLARWLLKLAYNAARARKWPTDMLAALKQTVGFIRGDELVPSNLRLYLQLIRSATIEVRDGVSHETQPDLRRFLAFWGPGMTAGTLVGMNAYHFHLVFWESRLTRREMQGWESKFLRATYGSAPVRSDCSRISIYTSSLNILDVAKANPLLSQNVKNAVQWLQDNGRGDDNSGAE